MTKVAITRAMHEFRAEVPALVTRSLEAALAAQAPPTVFTNPASNSNIAGKHPPPPPKFNGDKGDSKVSINAWLLHFLDWCALHSVAPSKRVAYAVQALEGSAVEDWY